MIATAIDLKRPLAKLLKELDACPDGAAWAKPYKSASEAWAKCKNPEWMLWALEKIGYTDEKLRLFACWCVRETPLANGRKVWDLLTDHRSRNAVEVAERFARGEATDEERAAARAAARDAAWDAWAAAWAAASAARDAASAAWDAQAKALRKIVGDPFR